MWIGAIKEELEAHDKNQTWEIVPEPQERNILTARWVFNLKKDSEGRAVRFEARLVARGFEQRKGVEFDQIIAPVAKIESLRFLLALCAQFALEFKQFDVSTAFLYGELNEQIFMYPPEGVKTGRGECLLLKKSLYGLKQPPRAWHSTLTDTLKEIGFTQIKTEPYIFINSNTNAIIVVYVDDRIVLGKNTTICEDVINKLTLYFKIKDTTCNLFLGMQIMKLTNSSLFICRSKYVREMTTFGLANTDGANVIDIDLDQLEIFNGQLKSHPYRSLIGGLLYLAVVSRPDIIFVVTFLSGYNTRATDQHWEAARQVLRYVKQTMNRGICSTTGASRLIAWSNADWTTNQT